MLLELDATIANLQTHVLKAAVGHLSILNRLPDPATAEGEPPSVRARAHELLGSREPWTTADRIFMANCIVTAVTPP